MNHRSALVAVSGVAVLALVAGCSSSAKSPAAGSGGASNSANNASGAIVNPGWTTKGGTVNILNESDYEHLDPVQNYVTNSGDIGRLIYRTLTFIKDTPNQAPEIKPDLAQSLGTKSADGKTWTWKIRQGLKYEDGTPITAKDIKYGIERSFAQDIYKDGATYMPDTLANTNNYAGPYKDPNKDLTAVQTPDDYTLVAHFAGPNPDADWMMSLFYTAPVPKAKDTKQDYDLHPVASGPYKIDSYTPKKSLVLVRNPNWDPATDPNRPALPDKFVVTEGVSASGTISARLISNQGDDQTAVTQENSGALQPADLPKLRQPDVQKRFTNGPTPCVYYDYYNTQTIKDPDVRKAISTAINRKAALVALGGDLFGTVTDSYMSTTVRGYNRAEPRTQARGRPRSGQGATGRQDRAHDSLRHPRWIGAPEGARDLDPERPEGRGHQHGARHHPGRRVLQDPAQQQPAGHVARRLVLGLADAGVDRAAGARPGQHRDEVEFEQLLPLGRPHRVEADHGSVRVPGRAGVGRQAVLRPVEQDPDHRLAADPDSSQPRPASRRQQDSERRRVDDLRRDRPQHHRRQTVTIFEDAYRRGRGHVHTEGWGAADADWPGISAGPGASVLQRLRRQRPTGPPGRTTSDVHVQQPSGRPHRPGALPRAVLAQPRTNRQVHVA